ncbi:Fe(3+) ABC transporter substrate-binding protein [Alishewanella sp. SMS8]|uniref:Fe(3+) ABC transporter substrate-binding protein n=1 Tax=unclassified Alishewanella TaxID=2628974 RepID=UPI0027422AFC|nr:Fe(3+) ABC transporter substrate-binding protein [Alishewanella sp. SMS8]MDP5034915.1 Fe(3+) ABC transporter substrate-binding protein [Alishewanella sp.]MDP5458821.1 Fe(3+) ABC transporter substrate-binding protein [Alishewanella sp. SMS8]
MKFNSVTLLVAAGLTSCLFHTAAAYADEVNVYSARQEELIKPLLDTFTVQTGIKVNLITGNADELITRMRSEGRNSPADLLLTTDVGRLTRAKEQGVLQGVTSDKLVSAIPSTLRDTAGVWYGLTVRARPIMYVEGKVDPAQLSTMEDLADPKWKGKICVRSSNNIYNQSHVASIIAHDGAAVAEQWAKGLVANFARPPQGGDRDQIKAAAAGVCDIALANTYYLAGMLTDPAEQAAAAKMRIFWPNQQDNGVHINISGAGVAAFAPNKANALKLLEYMVEPEAQHWYADVNNEYPVRSDVNISKVLEQFGRFKADELPLEQLGEFNAEAIRVMDRAGWR